MAKQGRTLQQLAVEIERRAEAKRDFVSPVNKIEVLTNEGQPVIALPTGPGNDVGGFKFEQFAIQEVAHGQLAEYAGIPMAYYRRMLAEKDPALLARNVNHWLYEIAAKAKASGKPERRMVRTLDGKVRALLSDGYRPLENEDLANVILPVLLDADLLILSCEITDRRMYIKAVDQRITRDVPTGRKMGDGSHVFFDTCSPAITISNSEVGLGTLAIETGVFTRACTNLAMIGTNLRKYHVGKRADLSDEVLHLLTDETKRQTDKAIWMQVRDVVKGAFDEAKFDAVVGKLNNAAQDRIEPTQAEEVVEVVSKRFSFNDGERKGILGRLIEGADLTRYGLHAAITRHSADVESYDRATELERIGGELIELPKQDWERFAKVA